VTVGSALVTVVLAAVGIAAFATNPFLLAVTLAIALAALGVTGVRLGCSLEPNAPVCIDDLIGTSEAPAIGPPVHDETPAQDAAATT
jgi:hypothetical protein